MIDDLHKYITTENYVSVVINGGIRNISTKNAELLVKYYQKHNEETLRTIFKNAFKFMVVLSNDALPESINECTRLFEFLCIVIILYHGQYKVSDEVGYKLRITTNGNEQNKQLVEVRFGIETDPEDGDEQMIGGYI